MKKTTKNYLRLAGWSTASGLTIAACYYVGAKLGNAIADVILDRIK